MKNTAGATCTSESRKVTKATTKKIVMTPMMNCLYFFLKSLTTYENVVESNPIKDSSLISDAFAERFSSFLSCSSTTL